jgi:outer membrane autotransporter protein
MCPVYSVTHLPGSDRAEEEKPEGRRGRRAYALNTTGRIAQRDGLQVPPAGGASPNVAFGLGQGLSVFFSAGAYALHHYNNRFEDGYDAQLPTVTLGGDYRINEWMTAGLAVNYTNYDGTYDDGGGFDKHIFGPLLYASFLPFDGAFTNTVLGYARQENHNSRLATASNENTGEVVGGHTSADYGENQYTAGILAGYDHPFGNVVIGPRLGLAFSHESFENFREDGDTGLELRYRNLNQTSVQSSLGVQASIGIETSFGILVPQAAVAWVHEFLNDGRHINARLVEASPSAPGFTFQREPPARDWANIGLGISALLPNGFQPFAQFTTIQGNENFVSYGGAAGLRKEF